MHRIHESGEVQTLTNAPYWSHTALRNVVCRFSYTESIDEGTICELRGCGGRSGHAYSDGLFFLLAVFEDSKSILSHRCPLAGELSHNVDVYAGR